MILYHQTYQIYRQRCNRISIFFLCVLCYFGSLHYHAFMANDYFDYTMRFPQNLDQTESFIDPHSQPTAWSKISGKPVLNAILQQIMSTQPTSSSMTSSTSSAKENISHMPPPVQSTKMPQVKVTTKAIYQGILPSVLGIKYDIKN